MLDQILCALNPFSEQIHTNINIIQIEQATQSICLLILSVKKQHIQELLNNTITFHKNRESNFYKHEAVLVQKSRFYSITYYHHFNSPKWK